jgi:hypothetical protein
VVGGCAPIIGIIGYYCHTPSDECMTDADCDHAVASLHCIYDAAKSNRWVCGPIDCTG